MFRRPVVAGAVILLDQEVRDEQGWRRARRHGDHVYFRRRFRADSRALPFSLKLIESALAENPKHEGLLLAATHGFAQYAYAFVQMDADEIERYQPCSGHGSAGSRGQVVRPGPEIMACTDWR